MKVATIAIATTALLAGCGQKGALYLPDQGLEAVQPGLPASSGGVDGVPANSANEGTTGTTPVTPATPDDTDASRKRIPTPPDPAKSP